MDMGKKSGEKVPVLTQVKTMGYNFWISNASEAMERLAFFGVRAVLPLYMFSPSSVLQLSMTEKGVIFGVWAWIQCLLPMVTGGYSDTYGYRKSLVVAFSLNFLGYLLMANITGLAGDSHALKFWLMMAAAVFVGTGTAVFKPPVQGAVAKALNEGNSGLGFGIFYWVVNIGGFLAPMTAAWLRGDPEKNPTWSHVFYGAAIVTALNLAFCLFFFREPERDPKAADKSPVKVFVDTMKQLWHDQAMFRFLLVVSGFWFMFMQLWDLLPNFLDEWVDSRDVGAFLISMFGRGASGFVTASGAAKPEILINIDSFTIILFVIPLSWFFGRYSMMTSLVLGMIIALVGFVGAGITTIGSLAALFIFVFAVGEIICSPKFSEYVGMTAPPDKKAQYMGYSNMPFAFGWGVGNFVSGPLYDAFSSKTELARKYLVEHVHMAAGQVANIEPSKVMSVLAEKTGTTGRQTVDLLWDHYHPWIIWCILGLVGLVSIVGMIWNYKVSAREA